MKLKRIITFLIIGLVILIGAKYAVKKYIYPYAYKEYVDKYSEEFDVDPLLVLAVMKSESGFNKEVESKKGAKGLMQIMDSTGAWIAEELEITDFTVDNLYDAETNIKFGCWYLDNLSHEFTDLNLIIASYNGGRGNVNKWLEDPRYSEDGIELDYIPFKETKKYVDKVNINYNIYKYFYRK